MRGRRWAGGLLALVSLLVLLTGCGQERPKPDMDFTLEQKGDGIAIVVKTTGFAVPKDGHIHIRLDGGPETMAYSNTYTLPKVSPGKHSVEVGLSDMQHRDLGVTKTKEIEVK